MKEKIKLTFLRLFENPLLKYLIFKKISCMQWLFWVIYQKSGTSFWCTFSAWFFKENVLYLILFQRIKFECHTFFPFDDIKQNLLLSSYLDKWWRYKLFRFIFDHLLKQWPTGRKRGEEGNTKIWISRERKELSRWNKKHFS